MAVNDLYGNVAQMVRADTRAVVARWDYDAYGKTTKTQAALSTADSLDRAQVNQPYRYQGHYLHAQSGLYDFGFRFYSPTLQRWMSSDPIEESGGINLHSYVGGNPTNAFDAFGMKPGDRYKTSDAAAIAAIDECYPQSDVDQYPLKTTKDREYGGFILRISVGKDGKGDYYTYTKAVRGITATDMGNSSPLPKNAVGDYHTHPTSVGILTEYFSNADERVYIIQSQLSALYKQSGRGYGVWTGYVGSEWSVRKWTLSQNYTRKQVGNSLFLVQGTRIQKR